MFTARHFDSIFRPLQERENAKSLFTTADNLPNQLATTISTTVSTQTTATTVTTDEPRAAAKAGRLMTKEEADRVRKAIASATSVEEIRRLERSLKEGYLPGGDAVGA